MHSFPWAHRKCILTSHVLWISLPSLYHLSLHCSELHKHLCTHSALIKNQCYTSTTQAYQAIIMDQLYKNFKIFPRLYLRGWRKCVSWVVTEAHVAFSGLFSLWVVRVASSYDHARCDTDNRAEKQVSSQVHTSERLTFHFTFRDANQICPSLWISH